MSEGTIYKQATNLQTLRVPLSYDNQIIIFTQQLLIMFIKLETRFILILLWLGHCYGTLLNMMIIGGTIICP